MSRGPPSPMFVLVTTMLAVMALTVAGIAIQRDRPGALGVLVFALVLTGLAGGAGAWRRLAAKK